MATTTLALHRMFGLRGDHITIVSDLYTIFGVNLGGLDIVFTWRSDFHRNPQPIGTAKTDSHGTAHIAFTIPTNPQDDNVIVTATYTAPTGAVIPENPTSATTSRRVEIGTRT